LLLWPLVASPAQISATTAVSVFVADSASGAPLVEAHVEFPALGLSQRTDVFGVAYFPTVKSGAVLLKVSRIGYVPLQRDVMLDIAAANGIELTVAMTTIGAAHTLDTVKVSGKTSYFELLSGFERRRNFGLGKFFTSAQLDSAGEVPLADLITRSTTGLRAEWGYARMGVRLVSRRGPTSISQPQCFVQVYVDSKKANDEDLAHILSGDLAGVEYYSIAPPPEYSATASCGVLSFGRNADTPFARRCGCWRAACECAFG
jgi:hypothetical protein